MKTRIIRLTAFAMLTTALLAGCSKEEQGDLKLTAELQMQYNALEFVVPPTPATGEVQITVALDGNALAQTLAANGYSMNQLKEFRFTNGTLNIESPDGATYDALERVSLMLSLAGSSPVTVASLDPVPNGAHNLTLDMPGANVADILRDSNVELIVKVALDGAITDTLRQKLDLGGRIMVQL